MGGNSLEVLAAGESGQASGPAATTTKPKGGRMLMGSKWLTHRSITGTVCTYDKICTCNPVHYWYPN